jgi:hypothetical protein
VSDTYLYRAHSFGSPVGGLMTAAEVVTLIESIRANSAVGLSDPAELCIERLDAGGWRTHAVVSEWEPRPEFSNPVADDG